MCCDCRPVSPEVAVLPLLCPLLKSLCDGDKQCPSCANHVGCSQGVEMFFNFSLKRGAALAEEIRQSDLDVSIGGTSLRVSAERDGSLASMLWWHFNACTGLFSQWWRR